MSYRDLREFIDAGRQARRAAPRRRRRSDISNSAASPRSQPARRSARRCSSTTSKAFRAGFRVFTNATTNPQRAALALGIDPKLRPIDALKAWKEKRQTLKPHQPVMVKDAPCLENSARGADVDLATLPGAASGTARMAVRIIGSGQHRDHARSRRAAGSMPRSIACRCTIGAPRDRAVRSRGRHGAIIAKKYWDAGKPCPLAVVNGEDPALFIAGFEYLPAGSSEYDFAGAIKGAPIEIVAAPAHRPADPRACRDHPRRRAPADRAR